MNVPLHIENVNVEGDGSYRSPTQWTHLQGRVTRFTNLLLNKKLLLNNNHPHPIINIFDIPTSANIQI